MRLIGLDTNVLAYLAGVDRSATDQSKISASRTLLARLAGRFNFVVTTQALGELFVVLTRAGATRDEAQNIIETFSEEIERVGTTPEIFDTALAFATAHKLQIWDSLIITASAHAGCSILLSEDLQNGFRAGTITIINPFDAKGHDKLLSL
jgi:predicted nucleic acid-binding protein